MEPETISSAQTPLIKFVLPTVWIAVFAGATIAMFTSGIEFQDANGMPPDPTVKWVFLGATILGAAFIWWGCVRLKRVRMDDRNLYVSNYVEEITVPLADVSDVTENRWVNTHPVTIHFHRATGFGDAIVFMPKVRWFGFWSSHPVVEDIQQAVNRATGRQ